MFRITSQVFEHNKFIPPKYTCDGENISPPLEISGVPESAKSLVLIMDEPDATRGVWAHWLLWNISPDTKEIPENSVPPGTTEGVTSFGRSGYGGPSTKPFLSPPPLTRKNSKRPWRSISSLPLNSSVFTAANSARANFPADRFRRTRRAFFRSGKPRWLF